MVTSYLDPSKTSQIATVLAVFDVVGQEHHLYLSTPQNFDRRTPKAHNFDMPILFIQLAGT